MQQRTWQKYWKNYHSLLTTFGYLDSIINKFDWSFENVHVIIELENLYQHLC